MHVVPFLILAGALISGCSSAPQADSGAMALPPVPVRVAVAAEEEVPIEIRAIGNVEASSSVEVKSQIAGQLLNVRFAEGGNVSQGDVLFEIDPRPYRDSLRQAEAAVARDTAEMKVAEATLAKDRIELERAESDARRFDELAKEGITPRNQQEQFRTAAQSAAQAVRADEAALESIRASMEANRAAVDRAKLDLSYAQITAPISGRAGNLLLHAGNLVKANDTPLVVINRITPVFVSFGIPERYLGAVKARSSGRKLAVEASVDQSNGPPAAGTLSVIDNTVDPATGTIRLKATFDNRGGTLWPGQFANVVLTLDTERAIVVPAEAVQAGQQGSFVYVVKEDQSVEPRPVTTRQEVGGKVIVESGIAPGDTVVTDGQSRLYPGAHVQTAEPAAAPAN